MPSLFAPSIRLPAGWASNVRLELDADGTLRSLTPNAAPAEAIPLGGPVVPGIPNLHSHAFQRALAGLGERAGPGQDDFWSWREAMYGFLEQLSPQQVRVIATHLYIELVEAGYSRVCEFHYLHRAPDGSAYADPLEMAWAHVAAAREAGIALTLAPCLYSYGDFGAAPASPGQRRFILTTREYLDGFARLAGAAKRVGDFDVAVCLHSLRAVSPDQLHEVLEATPRDVPVHMHVAEQLREVEACVAWSGLRPVEWLLQNARLDERWRLVHATHMSADETRGAAATGAVVIACPTTEGNLGDGFFPAGAWLDAGGALGIGTDSCVTVDPREELRWFEYARRLQERRRALGATPQMPNPGARLWLSAAQADARGGGARSGALAPGMRADFLVLDPAHPNLAGRSGDDLFDALVFVSTPGASPIAENWIGGQRRTLAGRHARSARAREAYVDVLRALRPTG